MEPLQDVWATGWEGERGLWKAHNTFCLVRASHDVLSDADALYCKLMGQAEALPSYVDFFHLMA